MAYAPPNEATVVAVGGLGTQANSAQLNGGGATKAVWDAGSPSDFMGANGGPQATATCAFTTATKNLNGTNIGLNVTVGTLCFVSAGDGAHVTAGVYEITTVTDNDNIICAQIDDDGTNDINHTVNVGGALDTLQNALDNTVNDGADFDRHIYDNISSETIAATIDIDINAGSLTTNIYVVGYNATLAAEAQVIITTDQNLGALPLVDFNVPDNFVFRNIDFDGGGKDANLAGSCIIASATGDGQNTVFYNCIFRRAESHGVSIRSTRMLFIDCEFALNGGAGYNNSGDCLDGLLINCSIHDNDSHGVIKRGVQTHVTSCLIYDNGKDGAGDGINESTDCQSCRYIGNTIHGNADNGLGFDVASFKSTIFNNTCVGNGGFGYDFNGGAFTNCHFFGFNHSSVNTTAHYSVGADGTFAAFGNGNNKADTTAAAALFENVGDGTEDFTPKAATDLIDNALDAGTA